MPTVNCRECGGKVAELAGTCPHCGNGNPSVGGGTKAVITIIVLALIASLIGWCVQI